VSRCHSNAGEIALTWSDTLLGIFQDSDDPTVAAASEPILDALVFARVESLDGVFVGIQQGLKS
jgi:hypothetical protein